MSLSDLNTLYSAYAAAESTGDYDAALQYLRQIHARVITSPADVQHDGKRILLNVPLIDKLMQAVRQAQAASRVASSCVGPWQSTKVTYKRAGAS